MAKKNDLSIVEQELASVQNLVASTTQVMSDDRDLVNQLLGQIKMAQSFSVFANVISTAQLKNIKENKLYKALDGKVGTDLNGNKIANVGTWEGFCQAVGVSRAKADDDILNLSTFGEEALKQLSSVGAGYRELRQFRKLPDDEKQALIEVAKEGDKEGFAEVAESIIAKHTKEKEALTKQLEDITANLEAARENAEKYSSKLQKVDAELIKVKKHIKAMSPEDMGEAIRKEAIQMVNVVEAHIRGEFYCSMQALFDHQAQTGISHSTLMSGMLSQLKKALNEVALELEIDEAFDDDPTAPFLREGAEEEAQEAIRKALEEAEINHDE